NREAGSFVQFFRIPARVEMTFWRAYSNGSARNLSAISVAWRFTTRTSLRLLLEDKIRWLQPHSLAT
ncbi:MAG: hypothetical protein LBI59_05255, partial [Candidatus Accumulibacter sp.]|nr:hypothetical protein [Accumulibacter sp.]